MIKLWAFSRYEAERSLRNVDHLNTPGGAISGPTADYLAANHKLLARFHTHLAEQLEPMIPEDDIEAAKA